MKQSNRFLVDMLDFDLSDESGEIIWRGSIPASAEEGSGDIILTVPFQAFRAQKGNIRIMPDESIPPVERKIRVRAYGDEVIRVTCEFGEKGSDDASPIFGWDDTLVKEPLTLKETELSWEVIDPEGRVRLRIDRKGSVADKHKTFSGNPFLIHPAFNAVILPDGRSELPFMEYDSFGPEICDSFSLAYVEREGRASKALFSLHADYSEKFAGTGERFTKMDLSGRTINLENVDAVGVNSPRAYKNIPFYLSNRPYGLFMATSAHIRLSLADISTRSANAVIEDDLLDLFFIGGGSPERILYNYRRITGFPANVPLWSYGTWMSRMSYRSADEANEVAKRLRDGGFPCDVIHIDVGWFERDWNCDWEFSKERYPKPKEFISAMREKGFRISLWQLPSVGSDTKHFKEAVEKRYVARRLTKQTQGSSNSPEESSSASAGISNFGETEYSSTIDFTNPEAVRWYQGMLERLFKAGVSAIKADFGEEIEMDAEYHGMPSELLHNLYALLYQRAAWEIAERTTGEGIIWARAGWAGCQRYPIHWGGDSACTWDGLAGTIRGGLHLGLSGFAFWSHDVPGFHGVPDFMSERIDDDLYVRWTQVGVFTSHIRYHGPQPREPYGYPEIAPIVRKWWRLRYALIPYIAAQGKKAVTTGYPVMRALLLHHPDDPICWGIDDQYYFGDSFLVAPILNSDGVRDIYLPEGEWVDLWTGEVYTGPQFIRNHRSPLERMPVFVVRGAEIPIYPYIVQSTNEMDIGKAAILRFDESYKGIHETEIGKLTEL